MIPWSEMTSQQHYGAIWALGIVAVLALSIPVGLYWGSQETEVRVKDVFLYACLTALVAALWPLAVALAAGSLVAVAWEEGGDVVIWRRKG